MYLVKITVKYGLVRMNISIMFLEVVIIVMAAQQVNAKSLQNLVSKNELSTDISESTSTEPQAENKQRKSKNSLTLSVNNRHCERGRIKNSRGECVDKFTDVEIKNILQFFSNYCEEGQLLSINGNCVYKFSVEDSKKVENNN